MSSEATDGKADLVKPLLEIAILATTGLAALEINNPNIGIWDIFIPLILGVAGYRVPKSHSSKFSIVVLSFILFSIVSGVAFYRAHTRTVITVDNHTVQIGFNGPRGESAIRAIRGVHAPTYTARAEKVYGANEVLRARDCTHYSFWALASSLAWLVTLLVDSGVEYFSRRRVPA